MKSRFPKVFCFLLVVFAVQQFFCALTLPLGAGPDEFAHLSYLQFLLQHHTLPVFGEATLYDFSNLKAIVPLPTVNWIVQHPPLYYLALIPFYALGSAINPLFAIYFMRFISILLALTTLIGAYKAIRLLKKSPLFAETVVAFIAFLPMFSYLTATVNNDNLLIALAAWLTYFLIKYLQENSEKNAGIIGILFTLCLITKFISVPLAVGILIVFLLNKPKKLKNQWIELLSPIFLAVFWYLHNFVTYGHLQPELKDLPPAILNQDPNLALNFPEILHQPHNYSLFHFFWTDLFPLEIYKNFWGVFGTLSTQLSDAQYIFIFAITFVAIIGLFKGFIEYGKNGKNFKAHILFLGATIATLLAMTIKIYQISASRGFLGAAQGRYMFIILIPIFYFLLLGISRISPTRWHQKIFTSLIILLIINNFFSIFFIILPQVF